MELILLTPSNYVTTSWAGGATTQLAISPEGALYADRDFLWRVSSATVELDESDFTPLPDYRRFISTLSGEMKLSHNGGAELTLCPGEVHAFDGADVTHSRGRCTDFNLMLRKGSAEGSMSALRPGGNAVFSADESTDEAIIYCASGSGCTSLGARSVRFSAGEALLLKDAAGTSLKLDCAEDTFLMAVQMRRL
ncbi:MAG: HutD family protein [Oscillospiraceae bacterium]|nr:HutD family protein [Oscillospiraceae bacterium]